MGETGSAVGELVVRGRHFLRCRGGTARKDQRCRRGLGAMLLTAVMYAFASWGMVANALFPDVMRVQDERGHAVVLRDPHVIVRHPGDAGALGAYFFTPWALGALWGLVMSALLAVALVLRTALEDRASHAGLEGYRDLASRVR